MSNEDLAKELLGDYAVVTEISVAWGDMDAFQHVNNVMYFRYLESVRIAYFLRSGVAKGAERERIAPILASTSCKFRAPVTYPDTLLAGARVPAVGEDRFQMEYLLVSAGLGHVATSGEGMIVAYDYQAGHKVDLPASWLRGIRALDGEPARI